MGTLKTKKKWTVRSTRRASRLIGQNGNKGHVGIEKGAEEADTGKQDVRPFPSALQERDQGEAKQDDKSQKRRDDISPGCLQTVRNHLSLSRE